jgi:outer membrane protein assembly factor BamB
VLVRRGIVVVVDTAGALTALDADRGTPRWTARTRRMQYAAAPLVAGRTVAMTTYGTGLAVVSAADGRRVANDHPGPVQLRVTFEGAATGGDGLYLLAGRSRGGGEIWMLSASG